MRLSDFWTRMNDRFGAGYAESVARDHVIAALRGGTVQDALDRGEDPKTVWRAVCEEFEVAARDR